MSYTIRHIGGARFEALMEGGETKEVGPNLIGMIRYTYFEDFSVPPMGWEVTQDQLMKDYHPKVFKDIQDGKIKPGRHDAGAIDWIEKM
jgi:hypothetical protein